MVIVSMAMDCGSRKQHARVWAAPRRLYSLVRVLKSSNPNIMLSWYPCSVG